MKNIKIFALMVLAVLSMGIVSCSNEDANEQPVSLKGKWYYTSTSQNVFTYIKEDNSMISYEMNKNSKQLWEEVHSTITTSGNEFIVNHNGGEFAKGTFKLEDNGNKLIMTLGTTTKAYTRLADSYDLDGEWELDTLTYEKDAVKDEIRLPSGNISDTIQVPGTLPTSRMNGEFLKFAINKYLRNIRFQGNQMFYTAMDNEQERPLSKSFALGDFHMEMSGELAGHSFKSKFIILQNTENSRAIILLSKANLADMFLGYAAMLTEGGISSSTDPAELEAFKQDFMDAFNYFSVNIRIKRKN